MSNNPIYIVGGRKDIVSGRYNLGVILRKDETGIHTVREYTSPIELQSPRGHSFFKGATRIGDRFYCCNQHEIVIYSLPNFEQIGYVTHPLFSDVHDVLSIENGNMLVAVADIEVVLEMTHEGVVVNTYNMLDETLDLDEELDYRYTYRISAPRAHVNHLVNVGGEIFVTRLIKKDAVSLTDITRRISIDTERSHDGFFFNSELYFTTVDGTIVVVDPVTLAVTNQHSLNTIAPSWCRGLLVDQETSWVGFTRRNETNMSSAPTRISRYNTADWMLWEEIDLETYGLNAVYSIIDAS